MGTPQTLSAIRERHEHIGIAGELERRPKRKGIHRQDTIIAAIMRAARALSQPFTKNQLVVRCWVDDQIMFGLAGYSRQFPDSNLTLSYLYGKRGLIEAGLLRRVGQGVFEVVGEVPVHERASDTVAERGPDDTGREEG